MKDRILQLQNELDEASEAWQGLSVFLWRVANVVYLIAVILPLALFMILALQLIVFSELAFSLLEDSSSPLTNQDFYLNPHFFALVAVSGGLYLTWNVFYNGQFRRAVKRMKNVVYYKNFELEAKKAIAHLEGRIKRLEK